MRNPYSAFIIIADFIRTPGKSVLNNYYTLDTPIEIILSEIQLGLRSIRLVKYE